ncbi:MAG: hypothetical protein CMF50_10570 [Legionellales bacterium]|nr:hypothetical protein [Legionellales bacterium]|tara:strand:+ start:6597 stop:7244 length:648 start_codon:yes stop_codon:yes gene_type:complete
MSEEARIKITKVEERPELEKKQKQRTRLMIFLMFLAPVMIAIAVYSNRGIWQESGLNVGTAIMPPVSLDTIQMIGADGSPLSFSHYRGRWILLYMTPVACREACIDTVYKMGQVRTGLKSQGNRVARLVVSLPKETDNPIYQLVESQYPTAQYATLTPSEFNEFNQLVPELVRADNRPVLYLVNPQGALIYAYHSNAPAEGILQDLKREMVATTA